MKVIPGWQLILALKLLTISSVSLADELQVSADGSPYSELAWLLLIAVLGFSVVARRPSQEGAPIANPAKTPASEPEHLPHTATVHELRPADVQQAPPTPQPLVAAD